MEKPQDYDQLFKLLIIGDSGVGKSSLLLRYTEDQFSSSYICTIGVDFKVKTINVGGQRVKLQVWDTAGQERFRTITSTYYRGAHGVIIVYDVNDAQSFLNVENWVKEAKTYADINVARILVGNKDDTPDRKVVDPVDAKKLAEQFSCNFLEASAKDNVNVEEMFQLIATEVLRLRKADVGRRDAANTVRVTTSSTKVKGHKSKCC